MHGRQQGMGGEIPQLRDGERLQAPSIEGAKAHGSLQIALLTILDTRMPREPLASQPSPALVLGIDAAWTAHNPSGVALLQRAAEGWQCLALAPSYEAFLALAAGQPWDQNRKAQGSEPDPAALLEACKQLAGQPVDCVSVDMPLATTSITSRRAADTAIASRFGPKGCAVHSPSAERPGAIADQLRERFAELGVPLHTTTPPRQGPAPVSYTHLTLPTKA